MSNSCLFGDGHQNNNGRFKRPLFLRTIVNLATITNQASKLVCCASGRGNFKFKNCRAPVAKVLLSAKVRTRQWLRQIVTEGPQACQVNNFLLEPGSPLPYNNYLDRQKLAKRVQEAQKY